MHKPVCTATSFTLYRKNSFIQIARYRRSPLDGRGISILGVHYKLNLFYSISPILSLGLVANALTLLLDNLSRNIPFGVVRAYMTHISKYPSPVNKCTA